MEIYDLHETFSALCKATKRSGLFLAFPSWESEYDWIEEVLQAAPFLRAREHMQALADGYAFILCDTIAERDDLYEQIVGDDGPTHSNPYSGPARIYALTCDAQGKFYNENT